MTSATPNERLERLWTYLQADPQNANLARDIAKEALGCGNPEQAVKALDHLCALGQQTPNDEAAALFALSKLGQFDAACARGLAALQAWPEDEAIRLETARALLNLKRFQEAADTLAMAFEDPPIAQMAGELTLQALWHLADVATAVEKGLALCAQWPQNPRILSLTSALLFDAERANEAFDLANQAYAMSSEHAYQSLHVLASERLLKQDVTSAFKFLDEAQRIRQDDGRIWLIRGSAHMVSGQMDQAIDDLKKAQRIFPDHPGTHLTLAWVYIVRKQLDDALAAAMQAIHASPAFAESHGTLATIHALKGENEQAQQSIRRATLLDSNSFAAKYAQALLDGTPPGRIEELFKRLMMRAGAR
jgi:tetratricopeptide (TPR) repeat protein